MRVLIIEDEAKTASYLSKGLLEQGYVADVASNGRDGLNELASAWRDDSSTDFFSLTIVIRVLGSDGVGMALMQGSDRVPWPSNSAKQNTPEMKKETGG